MKATRIPLKTHERDSFFLIEKRPFGRTCHNSTYPGYNNVMSFHKIVIHLQSEQEAMFDVSEG